MREGNVFSCACLSGYAYIWVITFCQGYLGPLVWPVVCIISMSSLNIKVIGSMSQ